MNAEYNPLNQPKLDNGIFYSNGEPIFVVSGDYPYYRDDPKNWRDRLEKMKTGGIRVVTFYVPWRHHYRELDAEGNQICDFEGNSQPNRNVCGFIDLIHDLGLFACVKPGPFIHAETDYGGLPDFVNPEKNPKIAPDSNFFAIKGQKALSINRWGPYSGTPLPSPLDPEFLRLTKEYYGLVAKRVVFGKVFPKGPIVLMQFLNEGLYSEGRMPYSYAGDYTRNNIRNYQKFLKHTYGSIKNYNQIHKTNYQKFMEILPPTIYEGRKPLSDIRQLHAVIDWNNYGIVYYATWVNELRQAMQTQGSKDENLPPLIANWNPEGDFGQGLDVWATRVDVEKIERLCGVAYGYTNWIGCVNYRQSAYMRYAFLCGRANGINMEENWGFGKPLYDWQYSYGLTPLYQTLLAIASGCTGYNVYTAVGTDQWDKNIDSHHSKPYPSDSPIDENGKLTNKYYLMAGLNKFFGEYYGKEFFECEQDSLFSIGFYQPYIQLAAFAGQDQKLWKKLGLRNSPVFGMDVLAQFHLAMRRLKMGYQILNLEEEPFDSPAAFHRSQLGIHFRGKKFPQALIFVSSRFLAQKVQEKLLNYAKNGGFLCLFGEIPTEDEHYQPCTILKHAFGAVPKHGIIKQMGDGHILFSPGNPFQAARGVRFFWTTFLTRFLMSLKLKIPGPIGLMDGKLLPYAEVMGMIGGDKVMPSLQPGTFKSINRILRLMQKRRINRKIDIQLLTTFKYRRNVDLFLYTHPKKNIQYLFLFSTQCDEVLPINLYYFMPEKEISVRIKTELVPHTVQLMRIEEGQLTAFVYCGINPISRAEKPLFIKINNREYYCDAPVDIIYISQDGQKEIYCAHGRKKSDIKLKGIANKPIEIPHKGKILLN